MRTFGKTSSKPNYLFGLLGTYFKVNDSYKDSNDEGLLERYYEIFCKEVDEEISPYLDEVLDITDASALGDLTRDNPTELLQYIADLLGNPPDISTSDTWSGGEDEYIVLIRYIRHILQTKGTLQSLIYYLAIYGYEIDTLTDSQSASTIYDVSPTASIHDNSGIYDGGFNFISGYALVITDLDGTTAKNPTQTWLDDYLLPSIQKFITPIWAELSSLTYTS